eukprot:5396264-Alexandrium_andersonii.AAC.1
MQGSCEVHAHPRPQPLAVACPAAPCLSALPLPPFPTAMPGPQLTQARLEQLVKLGHGDAVLEWERRRDQIQGGRWKGAALQS